MIKPRSWFPSHDVVAHSIAHHPPWYADASVHVGYIFEREASNELLSHSAIVSVGTTLHDVITNRETLADDRNCKIDLSFYKATIRHSASHPCNGPAARSACNGPSNGHVDINNT